MAGCGVARAFGIHYYVEWLSPPDNDWTSPRRDALLVGARATGEAMLRVKAGLRRLAAIVAADVADYSRLIEAGDTGALADPKSLRRDPIDLKIALHKGRAVKTTGDGTLTEFASGVEAALIAAG